jgi:hypothetical protein
MLSGKQSTGTEQNWHPLDDFGCLEEAGDLEYAQNLQISQDPHITVDKAYPTLLHTGLQRTSNILSQT